jgi:hypothetical protein
MGGVGRFVVVLGVSLVVVACRTDVGDTTTGAVVTTAPGPPTTVTVPEVSGDEFTSLVGPEALESVPEEGVRVRVSDSLQVLVAANPPGTTYLLEPGRHTSVSVVPKAGDRFIGMPGAVLDGLGSVQYAIYARDATSPVPDVVVMGLVVEHYASPPQHSAIGGDGAVGWLVEANEIRFNHGRGVGGASGMTIKNNYLHHNGQLGIGVGVENEGLVVEGNEIAFNNYQNEYDLDWEAGGAKFLFSTSLIVRDNYVHDNHGAGLWTDTHNAGTLYEGNLVIDNHGPGIHHEISFDAVIRNNRLAGNAFEYYRGGILVSGSQDVEVTGNILNGNDGGIVVIQEELPQYLTDNIVVRDNLVAFSAGVNGAIDVAGDGGLFARSLDFSNNKYLVPERYRGFAWSSGNITLDAWRALGMDA